MLFMNEFDIAEALARTTRDPILHRAARVLAQLCDEANAHSDGWSYWPKPCRAAKKLMELIQAGGTPSERDLTKALAPIRAFYTRFGRAAGMELSL